MPKKIRQLKRMLRKAGFVSRPGKGSHTVWTHPRLPKRPVTLSGTDVDDARCCQPSLTTRAMREILLGRLKYSFEIESKNHAGDQEPARQGRRQRNPSRHYSESERWRGPCHHGPEWLRQEYARWRARGPGCFR